MKGLRSRRSRGVTEELHADVFVAYEQNQDKATETPDDALNQQTKATDAKEADAEDEIVVEEVAEADSKAAQSKEVAEGVAGQPTKREDTSAAKAGHEASEAATKPKQSKQKAVQAAELVQEQGPAKKSHEETDAQQEDSKQDTPLTSLPPSGSGPAAQAESQGDADTFKPAIAANNTSAQATEKLVGDSAPAASKTASKKQETQPKDAAKKVVAPEEESAPRKDAIQKLAGESTRASSKAKTQQQDQRSKDRAADKAAPQQAAAADSAAPQVDILGSVQIAAPLQVSLSATSVPELFSTCLKI